MDLRSLGVLAAFTLALLPACSADHPAPANASSAGAAAAPAGLPDHDPALAHKLAAEGALVLDVRTPEEFSGKRVEGAVNIPVDEVEGKMSEIDKLTGGDKDKPIVVYCAAGGRAASAKRMLVKAGHTKVTNLGGVADWDRK
ncbi:MAG: rhodanese-like domain-containing protein [Byssovorax sp.]